MGESITVFYGRHLSELFSLEAKHPEESMWPPFCSLVSVSPMRHWCQPI
jgi:hypothetical protein